MSNTSASSNGDMSSRWEDWSNWLLALWLFVSPWALQFAPGAASDTATNMAAWTAWISAVAVAIMAIAALYKVRQWEEWVNAVVGVWILASPWIMQYSNLKAATWNAVVVGVLIGCLAGLDLYEINSQSSKPGAPA